MIVGLWLAAIGGVCVLIAAGGVVLRRRFAVITVDGLSMVPALDHGDRLLVARRSAARIQAGQIVVVERPDPHTGWRTTGRRPRRVQGSAWYVKRAVAVSGDPVAPELAERCVADLGTQVPNGHFVLIGDNARSDDSKQWGPCPGMLVFGVVLRKMPVRAG